MEEYKAIYKKTTNNNGSNIEVTGYSLLLGIYYSDLHISIPLSKVGPNIFVRCGNLLREIWNNYTQVAVGTFYIDLDYFDDHDSFIWGGRATGNMIHISGQETLSIREVMPQSHWDDVRQLFFRPLYGDTLPVMAAFCIISLGGTQVSVAVCVKFCAGEPDCHIFNTYDYPHEAQWLSSQIRLRNTATFEDVQIYVPSILRFRTSATTHDRGAVFNVSISLTKCVVEHVSNREIYSLALEVEKL
jgi:hypothetical protein